MGHIIYNEGNSLGIAVFLGKTQDRLYWLTCRHVLDAALPGRSLKINDSSIAVDEEYKFDVDLALLSTTAVQGNLSVTPRTLSFVMPKEVYLARTIYDKKNLLYDKKNLLYTFSELVHLTRVPPKIINQKTATFLYDFNEPVSNKVDDGESGSPILFPIPNGSELVGILTATAPCPVVLLFGAMSEGDKNKLEHIMKKCMRPITTPPDPLEHYKTWRKSEISEIEKALKQFSSKPQPHIVVLSGPAKVGKTIFLEHLFRYINEVAAPRYPQIYIHNFESPNDFSIPSGRSTPCIVICLNIRRDNSPEILKKILSERTCILVLTESRKDQVITLPDSNIPVTTIQYHAPDQEEIKCLIKRETEQLIKKGNKAPYISEYEISIISRVLSKDTTYGYGYHNIIKEYLVDFDKTEEVFQRLVDDKLWKNISGMKSIIESNYFCELPPNEKLRMIYAMLGRTWGGIIRSMWYNSFFNKFYEVVADRAGSIELQGEEAVYRCKSELRKEMLQKLNSLKSLDSCCAEAKAYLKSPTADAHALVAGFYLSLLTNSSEDAENFRESLFHLMKQDQVKGDVCLFELMYAMADYYDDIDSLNRRVTRCYADELHILGDFFSGIPAKSIEGERREICKKFQSSLNDKKDGEQFGMAIARVRQFLNCILKNLLSQSPEDIKACIDTCIIFYTDFCQESDEKTVAMCLRVANIVAKRVYELRRSHPCIHNKPEIADIVKAVIDSTVTPDKVERISDWADTLTDTGHAKEALNFLADYKEKCCSQQVCIAYAKAYRVLGDLSKAREVLEKAPRKRGPGDFELERHSLELARIAAWETQDYSTCNELLGLLEEYAGTEKGKKVIFLIEKSETEMYQGKDGDAWLALEKVEKMRNPLVIEKSETKNSIFRSAEDEKSYLMKRVYLAVETDRSDAEWHLKSLKEFMDKAPDHLFSREDKSWLLLREGRLLLDTPDSDTSEKHLEHAKEKFKEARKLEETEETLCWLAYAYRRLGNIEEAEKILNQAAEKISPGNKRWWLHGLQGDCHRIKSHGDEKTVKRAIELYEKAREEAKLPRNKAQALAWIGECQRILRQFKDAEDSFAKSEDMSPGYAEGLVQSAMTALEQNKIDDALQRINSAIDEKPQYVWAYMVRGFIFKDIGALSVAIRDFERAYKLNASNAESMAHWGEALRLQDKIEEAEKKLKEAIAAWQFPKIIDFAYVGLAEIELKRENFSEAQQYVEKALKINSESPWTLATQAKIAIEAGEKGVGIKNVDIEALLNRAIKGEQNGSYSGIYHFYLAQYYNANGRQDEARDKLNQAIAILDKRATNLPRYERNPFGLREEYGRMLATIS